MATRSSLPAPIDAEIRQKARDLFFSGQTNCAEIARELNLSESTIRAWANREKWRAQAKVAADRPELPAEERLAVAKSGEIFPPTDMDLAGKQEHYQQSFGDAAIRLADHVSKLDGPELIRVSDKLLKADTIARKALRLETEQKVPLINIGILCGSSPQRTRTADPGVALRDNRNKG